MARTFYTGFEGVWSQQEADFSLYQSTSTPVISIWLKSMFPNSGFLGISYRQSTYGDVANFLARQVNGYMGIQYNANAPTKNKYGKGAFIATTSGNYAVALNFEAIRYSTGFGASFKLKPSSVSCYDTCINTFASNGVRYYIYYSHTGATHTLRSSTVGILSTATYDIHDFSGSSATTPFHTIRMGLTPDGTYKYEVDGNVLFNYYTGAPASLTSSYIEFGTPSYHTATVNNPMILDDFAMNDNLSAFPGDPNVGMPPIISGIIATQQATLAPSHNANVYGSDAFSILQGLSSGAVNVGPGYNTGYQLNNFTDYTSVSADGNPKIVAVNAPFYGKRLAIDVNTSVVLSGATTHKSDPMRPVFYNTYTGGSNLLNENINLTVSQLSTYTTLISA